jgi:hypothetical protein
LGRRLLTIVLSFFLGAVAAAWLLLHLHANGYIVVFPPGSEHVELLSLFLAAATLVIAAVTLLLALGAVVGYGYIKDAATEAGKRAGSDAAGQHLGPFVRRLEALLTAAEAGGTDRTEELKDALSGGAP